VKVSRQSLFIGVGSCFLTTVLILPGILGWIEKQQGKTGQTDQEQDFA
jgi:hypothetical protein